MLCFRMWWCSERSRSDCAWLWALSRADVLNWVARRGIVMALVGTGIGLALSAVVTRYTSDLLFGVKPLDAARGDELGSSTGFGDRQQRSGSARFAAGSDAGVEEPIEVVPSTS